MGFITADIDRNGRTYRTNCASMADSALLAQSMWMAMILPRGSLSVCRRCTRILAITMESTPGHTGEGQKSKRGEKREREREKEREGDRQIDRQRDRERLNVKRRQIGRSLSPIYPYIHTRIGMNARTYVPPDREMATGSREFRQSRDRAGMGSTGSLPLNILDPECGCRVTYQ